MTGKSAVLRSMQIHIMEVGTMCKGLCIAPPPKSICHGGWIKQSKWLRHWLCQLLSLALYHHQKWNTRIQEPGVAPEGNPADLGLRMCSCDCIDGDHAQAKQNGLHFSRLIQLLQLPNFQPVRNRTRCWVCDIAASFEDANSHLRASWRHWIPYPPTVAARNSDRNMYVF